MIFFQPNDKFMNWLVGHINGRLTFDVGCGDAHLLRLLLKRNVKVMGIEPYWDVKDGYDLILPVLPLYVQRTSAVREYPGLIIIARPDHSGWVRWVPENAHPESEILYISKPSNVEVDLPDADVVRLKAPSCPEEHVYQVIRKVRSCVSSTTSVRGTSGRSRGSRSSRTRSLTCSTR